MVINSILFAINCNAHMFNCSYQAVFLFSRETQIYLVFKCLFCLTKTVKVKISGVFMLFELN